MDHIATMVTSATSVQIKYTICGNITDHNKKSQHTTGRTCERAVKKSKITSLLVPLYIMFIIGALL
jgi:hypothetical protein